jgi:hypothetical protein
MQGLSLKKAVDQPKNDLGVRWQASLFPGPVNLSAPPGGSLPEAEVKLESIEPGDRGFDAFGAEFRRQVFVLCPKEFQVGSIVVGHEDRVVHDPDVAVEAAEDAGR